LFAKPVSPEEIATALVTADHNSTTEQKISPPSIRQPIQRPTRTLIA